MTCEAPCPVCNTNGLWDTLCELGFGTIVRCAECGLVRTWPPRTGGTLAALHGGSDYFCHPYFEARRDLGRTRGAAKHRELLSRLNADGSLRGGRLLDIGCDTGTLCAVAQRDFGMAATGVEVSIRAAERARRENGIEVLLGDVACLHLPQGHYRLITMVDVLEHMAEPLEVLRTAARLLSPDGRLCIVTMNHDALIYRIGTMIHRLFGGRAAPLLEKLYIPYHEYYFTRSTLERLVAQSGLAVVYHRSMEFPLSECGYGAICAASLLPVFVLQWLARRQTLQELVARQLARREATSSGSRGTAGEGAEGR